MNLKDNNKFHDFEIYGIIHKQNNLNLFLKDSKNEIVLEFNNLIHTELTNFSEQNVIFELNYYKHNEIPKPLTKEFNDLNLIKGYFELCHIDSSTGIYGIIAYEKLNIINENL